MPAPYQEAPREREFANVGSSWYESESSSQVRVVGTMQVMEVVVASAARMLLPPLRAVSINRQLLSINRQLLSVIDAQVQCIFLIKAVCAIRKEHISIVCNCILPLRDFFRQ